MLMRCTICNFLDKLKKILGCDPSPTPEISSTPKPTVTPTSTPEATIDVTPEITPSSMATTPTVTPSQTTPVTPKPNVNPEGTFVPNNNSFFS